MLLAQRLDVATLSNRAHLWLSAGKPQCSARAQSGPRGHTMPLPCANCCFCDFFQQCNRVNKRSMGTVVMAKKQWLQVTKDTEYDSAHAQAEAELVPSLGRDCGGRFGRTDRHRTLSFCEVRLPSREFSASISWRQLEQSPSGCFVARSAVSRRDL